MVPSFGKKQSLLGNFWGPQDWGGVGVTKTKLCTRVDDLVQVAIDEFPSDSTVCKCQVGGKCNPKCYLYRKLGLSQIDSRVILE
eukprot:5693794-Amphidinium_carterae.1